MPDKLEGLHLCEHDSTVLIHFCLLEFTMLCQICALSWCICDFDNESFGDFSEVRHHVIDRCYLRKKAFCKEVRGIWEKKLGTRRFYTIQGC